MSAASRQKRRRDRVRRGEAVFRISAPQDALVEYLVETGRVSEAAARDHTRVEQALREAVLDLVARWRHA